MSGYGVKLAVMSGPLRSLPSDRRRPHFSLLRLPDGKPGPSHVRLAFLIFPNLILHLIRLPQNLWRRS